MAVCYSRKEKRFTWTSDDIYCLLEDEYWRLMEVLAENKLDGHNKIDQWLMKVEVRMRDLLDVLDEDTRDFSEQAQMTVVS